MSDIRDILLAARQDVDGADLPSDLRAAAFVKAIELHTAQRLSGSAETARATAVPAPSADAEPSLVRLAERLDAELPLVLDVFDASDGEITLIVAPGKLPSGAAPATKLIALLVAAGRQGTGVEDWTPVEVIRQVAEDYKRLDGGNFATTIKEMQNIFTFRGTSRKREVKMTRPAWADAGSAVKTLAGSE